jgi:hypothetical protein
VLQCSSELIHLNSIRQPSLNYNCAPFFFFCVQPGHLPTQPDLLFFFLKKIKEREWDLFSGIFILKSEFFYVVKKIYTNLVFRILGFRRNYGKYIYIYIYIYQNLFSCVLHTANTLTCFERSFFIYKNYWKFWKCVFAWIS